MSTATSEEKRLAFLGCIGHSPNCECKTCCDARLITEAETAELIRRSYGPNTSCPGHVLPLRFGPGWVALELGVSQDHWAYQALAQIRGIAP